MSRYQNTLALVINRRRLLGPDQTLTLLTPNLGKIRATAKNSFSPKSSRQQHLQLGNLITVSLYQKNNFYWIAETKSQTSFLTQTKNLAQLNLLFYFLEIINQLIAENQHIPGIFNLSAAAVTAIKQNNFKNFIQNEIEILKLLGFGLPQEIIDHFNSKEFPRCQQLINRHLESILERPLETPKLFR